MTASAARWTGRGAIALGALVVAVNLAWIGRHWDQVRPVTRGDIAPSFALPRLDRDGRIALADLRGQVVVVDFWATWCGPCIESMPAIERVYRRHHDAGLEVVSINTDDPAKARQVAREMGLSFPIAADDGRASAAYHVTTIPHLVVIDRRGVIAEVHRGGSRGLEAHLSQKVSELTRPPP